MYKKKVIDKFSKDGYDVSLLDIDYEDVSICVVSIDGQRRTYCRILNYPIFYYIIEGEGKFFINDEISVKKDILVEIPANNKYTYSGHMKMLEIIPKSFNDLKVKEDKKTDN